MWATTRSSPATDAIRVRGARAAILDACASLPGTVAAASYEKKAGLLDALEADVSVIQECARPSEESESLLWFGDNPRQGPAVAARGDYRLRRVRRARGVPKYVVPVEVTGPRSFLLFAVWTKTAQEHCYVEAAVGPCFSIVN